ncbi:metaxin-1-like [Pomacea canaliculata]|uniref:metaxin-1-like n=1 Tax=Pomacea canaliculata TaxID=400727 RepID=UPI000D73E44B|nr:metaxin-1-like [Pomacea canaliculata]
MAAGDDRMELQVWKGDWGLPSIDPNCLAVLAYCKFSGVPVDVKITGNPWKSPSGELPSLRHVETTETNVQDIFAYLRKQNWGSDFELSTKQSADVVAFSSMLEEKLLPAILHLWWVDGKTFVDFTRPWYAKVVPFPLNFFLPSQKQKAASLRVFLTKGGENISDSDVEVKIYKEAKECLNLLSYKLGSQEYMFGKQPSSLDAIMFGYLAPILKAPLPSNQLQTHLKQCDNLVNFINEILQRYFPPNRPETEARHQKEDEGRRTDISTDDAEFPHKRRNMILAAIFAITAMLGYAFMSGLIQLHVVEYQQTQTAWSESSTKRSNKDQPSGDSAPDPLFEEQQNENQQ